MSDLEKKVYIILDPKKSGAAAPIKETFRRLMRQSFLGIGSNLVILDNVDKKLDFRDSVVIFIVPPKRVINSMKFVNKNNNIFIVWNFESITREGGNRASMHTEYVRNICKSLEVDHVWHFAEHQIEIINNKKFSYLPMGFDEGICLQNICKISDIIFLGALTENRKDLFSKLKNNSFVFRHYNGSDYVNFDNMIRDIGSYRIGIDSVSERYVPNCIRWHRIMLYAANKIVCVMDNNLLEKYGFENGKHYFSYKFGDRNDLLKVINNIVENYKLISSVAENMYNKIDKDFRMKDLMIRKMQECKIDIF